MVDLLRTASNFLGDKLKAFASSPITYKRGLFEVTLMAHFGRTEFEVDTELEIVRETSESRDFIVMAADLVLNLVVIDPKEGDQIEWSDGGSTYKFEVMLPPSEPPWRWADVHHQRKRIHCKFVEKAT